MIASAALISHRISERALAMATDSSAAGVAAVQRDLTMSSRERSMPISLRHGISCLISSSSPAKKEQGAPSSPFSSSHSFNLSHSCVRAVSKCLHIPRSWLFHERVGRWRSFTRAVSISIRIMFVLSLSPWIHTSNVVRAERCWMPKSEP